MNKYQAFAKYYKHVCSKKLKTSISCLGKCSLCWYHKYTDSGCGVFFYIVKKYKLKILDDRIPSSELRPVLKKEHEFLKIQKMKEILK